MAETDFHINGPTVVKWAVYTPGGETPTFTNLGYTDNDDLIRIVVTDHKRLFNRNDSGDMISQAVMSGSTAVLDMTLISWDEEQLNNLLYRCRTGTGTGATIANQGNFASVGGIASTTASTTGRDIAIQIQPTNTGADIYLFPKLMLNTGPEYLELGNTAKRLAWSFITMYDSTATTSTFAVISTQPAPPTP